MLRTLLLCIFLLTITTGCSVDINPIVNEETSAHSSRVDEALQNIKRKRLTIIPESSPMPGGKLVRPPRGFVSFCERRPDLCNVNE